MYSTGMYGNPRYSRTSQLEIFWIRAQPCEKSLDLNVLVQVVSIKLLNQANYITIRKFRKILKDSIDRRDVSVSFV